MIKLITGGIGSGKTITAIKEIVRRKIPTYVNFSSDAKYSHRLKVDDIIKKVTETNNKGKEKELLKVNWDFWEKTRKKGMFDVYLDEVHNVLNSRRSMSKWNILAGIWLSQIRKIFDSSEKNHLYLMSQKLARVDIIARDLLYYIIYCQKVEMPDHLIETEVMVKGKLVKKMLPSVFIFNIHFTGVNCVEKYMYWEYRHLKTYDFKTYFLANPYYKFYNSYEIIKFGDEVYL